MFRDPQFVITFQLALIGIVLIGGLFLVWKAISRIEEKVDMILIQQEAKAMGGFKLQLDNNGVGVKPYEDKTSCCPMEMMMSDPLMQKLFKEQQEEDASNGEEEAVMQEDFVIFSTNKSPFSVPDGEDHVDFQPSAAVEEISENPQTAAYFTPSEVSEAVGTISRNKLRQMNLDKIKVICEERGLSSDGTKNQLIERILQL